MSTGRKCPACGLMQLPGPTCKSCGSSLASPRSDAAPPQTPRARGGRFASWLWPTITDSDSARASARQGVWAASFVAAVTTVLAVLSQFGVEILAVDLWALVDAALFAITAWGLYRMSRTAAFGGLAIYLAEQVQFALDHGLRNPVMPALFTLMFINSIRGTLAYHRLRR